ncbi:Integrin alpha-M [Labeo rohita]|uniref:Integrin alpha-M n=1 Tax=Labeo rohita TaxID=84645 RepID=A0ABQ8N196_LABRO|nr:Integrin alpha-M [Labeo rohita]
MAVFSFTIIVCKPQSELQPSTRYRFFQDSVIVGSVGSNDWRGALYEVTGSGSEFRETEITDPAVSRDSYMGYSTVLGTRGGVPHLFSGAPRAEHTGLVTLFTKNKNTWTVTRNIKGEQIGSYFGASLSLLDVDSDGDSDFLLVGAPLFYQSQPRTEGRLYVYAFSEQNFQKMLNVSESTTGRFAASLASLKDLNGDSLSDVAVGAPLEDEGVVYIYLGDRTLGINPKHAPQRIPARSVLSGLQQFGVSLSGQMDMNDDNLTDIVIGAQGGIVLLKARPVMSVSAQLSFSPKEISLNYFECPGDSAFNAFNLSSCFTVTERTGSTGSLEKKLNVSLNLNVDVVRGMSRGFFDQKDSSSRTLQQSVLLDPGFSCFPFSIFMLVRVVYHSFRQSQQLRSDDQCCVFQRCVADTVLPLKIQINFSQSEIVYKLLFFHLVPFQRNCNSNSSCVADLKLNFSFTNDTLVVENQAHFTVLVTLANPGDDSYNTSIVLHYPEGLSLSKFEPIEVLLPTHQTQESSRTRSSCGDGDGGATNRTTCRINQPVYRSNTTTQFLGTFRVTIWDRDWSDRMEMMIIAGSDNNSNQRSGLMIQVVKVKVNSADNNRNTTDSAVRRSVPVQFSVDLAISLLICSSSWDGFYFNGFIDQHCIGFISSYSYTMINLRQEAENSVTYLNFSVEDKAPKPLDITYKVENLRGKGLPVSVTFTLPCQTAPVILTHHSISVHENKTLCDFKPEQQCLCVLLLFQDGHCGKFECRQFNLQKTSAVYFNLTAQAALHNMTEYEHINPFKEIRSDYVFNISAELHYNTSRYNQTLTGLKKYENVTSASGCDDFSQTAVKVEVVDPPSRMLIVSIGAVGGFILLIIIFLLLLRTSSSRMETLGLILFMWASLSGAFNVDTEHPLRFNGTPDDFFGQIYSCTADLQFCEQLQSPGSESVRFFGMSAAVSSAAVTSCSPYVPHECDGNSYLNGVCYQFNSSSQAVSNFTAAYQECTKREVNLVFLFDGSSSMKAHEFQMNKDFIKNIMKTLSNSSIKFAAVQFSSDIRTVFDFNDYQNGFAEEKLKNEAHMKSLTNTYRAINYILNNLLNNVLSGANPNAVKALVIITDGEPSDNDNKNVLKTCDEQNILRYVIGGQRKLTAETDRESYHRVDSVLFTMR